MQNGSIQKFRSRVKTEAIVKSVLIGSSAGFGVAALMGLLSWFFGFKAGLYIAIGLFFLVAAPLSAVLYVKKFRPTTTQVAHRIDELGLEERVITMTELEGDDSYIATAQRADTMNALASVNHLMLKIAVTASMIVAVVLCGSAFAGSVTVSGLHNADVIPSGISLLEGKPEVATYTVNYTVARDTKGTVLYYTEDWDSPVLFGEEITIQAGEDAPAVLALPEEGWVFLKWSDGKKDPYRQDLSVGGNIELSAVFAEMSDELFNVYGGEEDAPALLAHVEEGLMSLSMSDGKVEPYSKNLSAGRSVDLSAVSKETLDDLFNDEVPEKDHIEIPTSPDDPPSQPPDLDDDYRRSSPGNQIEEGHFYGDNFKDALSEAMEKLQSADVPDDMKRQIADYLAALDPGDVSDDSAADGGDEEIPTENE